MSVLQMISPNLLEITEAEQLFDGVEVIEDSKASRQHVISDILDGRLAHIAKVASKSLAEQHRYYVELAYPYDPTRIAFNGVIAVCSSMWRVPLQRPVDPEPIIFAEHKPSDDRFMIYHPRMQPELAAPGDIFDWYENFKADDRLIEFEGELPQINPNILRSDGVEDLIKIMRNLKD